MKTPSSDKVLRHPDTGRVKRHSTAMTKNKALKYMNNYGAQKPLRRPPSEMKTYTEQ